MTSSNPSSPLIWPIGWTVRHIAETGSTNDDLMAAARDGAPHRSVIVADFQSAGRGRLDRSWQATRGSNLLVSLLFRYTEENTFRFVRAVALAARAACGEVGGAVPDLKWPNDLIIGSRKLGGLLAVGAPQDHFVVVGLGVNVLWAPEDAVCLRDVAVSELVEELAPLRLLQRMLGEIDQRLALTDDAMHAEHTMALATLGKRVRVDLRPGDHVSGVAESLDASSRLLVRDDAGQLHVIDVGDVMHLRTQ